MFWERQSRALAARSWEWWVGGRLPPRGTKEVFGAMETFYILIVEVVTQLYTLVKTHTIHL